LPLLVADAENAAKLAHTVSPAPCFTGPSASALWPFRDHAPPENAETGWILPM